MSKTTIPPYFSNLEDDTHCFQAVIKMLLKYYFPDEDYTFEQLDILTGKKPGKWTWTTRGLLEMSKKGLKVFEWESFDRSAFVARGADYLVEHYGEEVAKMQIANSDIDDEIELFRQVDCALLTRVGAPTFDDLRQLLDQGYLLGCNVNARTLNSRTGYAGHFVLVYEITESMVIMHDPGLPALPSREVSHELFQAAWTYSGPETSNVTAFRLN